MYHCYSRMVSIVPIVRKMLVYEYMNLYFIFIFVNFLYEKLNINNHVNNIIDNTLSSIL